MIETSDLDKVIAALENVGNTYQGATKTLLHAVAKEIKRLKRYEYTQRKRASEQRERDRQKRIKVYGTDPDDDIPF